MNRSISALLAATLAATALAPASAGPHEHGGQGAARAAAAQPAAQPQIRGDNDAGKHAAPPPRAPRVEKAAQPRFENRPARAAHFEIKPVHVENRPAPVEHAVQPRFENKPVRFENRRARVQNVQARANPPARIEPPTRTDSDRDEVPFANVVRPKAVRLRNTPERTDEFVAGRVVGADDDDVFVENPLGQTIVVRGWHGKHKHWHWGNQIVTIPVVVRNGVFYAFAPGAVPVATTAYVYPSALNYGYAPVYSYSQDYANYAAANTLTNVVSSLLNGSGGSSLTHSLLTNYLTSYALSSMAGNTAAYAPVYANTYAVPVSYAPASSPLTYTYPMTCVYNDPYNGSSYYDPSCAPVATTTYYTAASAYAPAQVQGVVVGTSGSTLMVLGANGLKPVLVNDAPALANGLALSGQPAVGRLVTAYGFYDGNTFVATALQ